MRRLHPWVFLGVLTATWLGESLSAHACRCKPGAIQDRFKDADAVVLGKVKTVEVIDAATSTSKVVVWAERSWKGGALTGAVTVLTDGTCAFSFTAGESYVLFLQRTASGDFGTTKCAGNKAERSAATELSWLEKRARAAGDGASAKSTVQLLANPIYADDETAVLITVVNLAGPALKVARRFDLASDVAPSSPVQLWFDVEDEAGKRLPYQCGTKAEQQNLGSSDFALLGAGEGFSRLVSVSRCFDLTAGRTYKITPHFKQTRPSISPSPKGAFEGQLSAPPISVTARARSGH